MKKSNKIVKLIAAMLLLTVVLGGCNFVRVNPEVDKNTVVATAAGEEIKKEEFNKIFGILKIQYEQNYGTDVWEKEVDGRKTIDIVKEKVLDSLIDTRIQMKKADELGIKVSEEELNTEINKFKGLFDSEERFNEFLTSQKIDMEYFEYSLKRDLIINKLRVKLTENIKVTDEEVTTYYGANQNEFIKVKASHILLDTEEEARNAIQRLNQGEDFNKLAKEISKDPSAQQNSGDLGYFKHGDMVEPFETAAFALAPGKVSDIVRTDYGFHIIKVEDKKLDKLEDVRDELKANLLSEKTSREYEKLLEEMRKNADIKKYPKFL